MLHDIKKIHNNALDFLLSMRANDAAFHFSLRRSNREGRLENGYWFIVSGGGITNDNEWKQAKKNDYRFLFPVKAMSVVFRAKFLEGLKQLVQTQAVIPPAETDMTQLLNVLYQKDWVVYAKAPFGGPHAVIEYLGRYTHKVAISNHRICSVNDEDGTVTFTYKDYG